MTRKQLESAGFGVDPAAYERLRRFVALLLDENTRLNLTAIRTDVLAWPLHVCDSLALLPVLAEQDAGFVIDVGTGGGVPGVPLACAASAARFVLVDSTKKKIDAVRRVVSDLGLSNVECVWGRAESLAGDARFRGSADMVVARAVAKLPELVGYAGGFLRTGGSAVFMKSIEAADAEIAAAEMAARRAGLTWTETRQYELPAPHGRRCLVIYRKAD
jgi:16S rRNA (guanine527-N7)-methyltransferase